MTKKQKPKSLAAFIKDQLTVPEGIELRIDVNLVKKHVRQAYRIGFHNGRLKK